MTTTLYSHDDIAQALAEADGRSWFALETEQADRYREMARVAYDVVPEAIAADAEVEIPEPDESAELAAARADAINAAGERDALQQHVAKALGVAEWQNRDRILEAAKHAREEGAKDALVPSRENATTKARRLLIDGRLVVERVVHEGDLAGLIVASCRGDSAEVYRLGYDPRARAWRCTCPELRGHCSHLAALKLVTLAPSAPPTRGAR